MNYVFNSRLGGLRLDHVSGTFAILVVVVTALGIAIYDAFVAVESVEPVTSGMSSGEQAATGIAWAIFEAMFAGVSLLLALLWKRLPEPIRSTAKTVGKTGVLLFVGGFFATAGNFITLSALLLTTVGAFLVFDELDLYWIVNDLLIVAVAAYLAAFAGYVLSPWVLAAALVGLSIYDHIFANKKSWMLDLMKPMVKLRLPVVFIVPTTWRHDWNSLAGDGSNEDGSPDSVGFGIGMADLALPAAFVVSVFASVPAPAISAVTVGIVAGLLMACARMSWQLNEHGSGAGLPPLTGGALAGWALGSIWMVMFL